MIIDYRADPGHALQYRVLDAATGEDIDLPAWYADDEAGVLRVYDHERRASGAVAFRVDPVTDEVPWTEHRRAIRIVPRGSWRERSPQL